MLTVENFIKKGKNLEFYFHLVETLSIYVFFLLIGLDRNNHLRTTNLQIFYFKVA